MENICFDLYLIRWNTYPRSREFMLWHSMNSSRSPYHANRFNTFCTLQTPGSSSLFVLEQWCTLLLRLASVLTWHNRPRAARKLFQCIPPFLMDCCRRKRARAQRGIFSLYNTVIDKKTIHKKASYTITRFLMDCVRKRPRAARKMFQSWRQFFSGLRRNRPENVCRWNANPRLPETFVYLKCNYNGDGSPKKFV